MPSRQATPGGSAHNRNRKQHYANEELDDYTSYAERLVGGLEPRTPDCISRNGIWKKGETTRLLREFFTRTNLLVNIETSEKTRFAVEVLLCQDRPQKIPMDRVLQLMLFSSHAQMPKASNGITSDIPDQGSSHEKLWNWILRCATETFFSAVCPYTLEKQAIEAKLPRSMTTSIFKTTRNWTMESDITPLIAEAVHKFLVNITQARREARQVLFSAIGVFIVRCDDDCEERRGCVRAWICHEDCTFEERGIVDDLYSKPQVPRHIQDLADMTYKSNEHVCAHLEAECNVMLADGSREKRIGKRYISIVDVIITVLAKLFFPPGRAVEILQGRDTVGEFVRAWTGSFIDEKAAIRTTCCIIHHTTMNIANLVKSGAEKKLEESHPDIRGLFPTFTTMASKKREIINPTLDRFVEMFEHHRPIHARNNRTTNHAAQGHTRARVGNIHWKRQPSG